MPDPRRLELSMQNDAVLINRQRIVQIPGDSARYRS